MRSSQLPRGPQARPVSWHAFVGAHAVKALKELSGAIFWDSVTGVADCHFHRAVDGQPF
jgi:hypothetical protein